MTWKMVNICLSSEGFFAEGGGELHETNRSQDKKEIGKEII